MALNNEIPIIILEYKVGRCITSFLASFKTFYNIGLNQFIFSVQLRNYITNGLPSGYNT